MIPGKKSGNSDSVSHSVSGGDSAALHSRYRQQARWTAELRRFWFQRLGRETARRVLEVGCGPGAVLATLVPSPGQLVAGLDLSYTHLAYAKTLLPNAALIEGDAHRLPFAPDSFDIVFGHYLLLWLTNSRLALTEMQRITRPGGWIMALAEPDYGGRVDYPQVLAHAGRLQAEALQVQGADTEIGRKLFGLFNAIGLVEVTAGVLGGEWHAAPAADDWLQELAVLRADLGDRLSPAELEAITSAEEAARKNGERVLFVPTFYAVGRKAAAD